MVYRVVLGSILACVYLLIFTGTVDWFERFYNTQSAIFDPKSPTLARAKSGLFFIYIMALASVYLIVFAKETYKIFLACFLIFITFAVFYAF